MKKDLFYSVCLILVAVISRLVAHSWNFTAMGAIAVIAGFLISNRSFVFITVLSSLLISDAIIGFYNTIMAVYIGYAIMVILGIYFSRFASIKNIILSSLLGSISFFIISNGGVWIEGQIYPQTFSGLMNCFEIAIPFFRNEVISNLILAPVLYFVLKTLAIKTRLEAKNYPV